jgi:hypothetical protein
LFPAGTVIAPTGAVAGPLSSDVLPQIFAGGELGHDPFGAGSVVVDVVGTRVAVVVGAAVVVVGAEVVGGAVVVAGAEVVGGAVVVAAGAGAVVVVVGAGAVDVVFVGELVGVVVSLWLATVKSARRLDLLPFDQVSRTLMVCEPSASFVVSYGSAVPSGAVPAKSKGGSITVRMGGFVRHEPSR